MTSEKTRSLWGQDFRVVAEGLAETDVVIFAEKLMRQHRESLKQLDHINSLHDLATKTVEDAEKLAANIREKAMLEAEAASARTVEEAQEKARQIIEEAKSAATERLEATLAVIATIHEEAREKERERMARIESALKALKESAVRELSTRMPSHYIGKHLYQSVHFIPAFERLMKEIEANRRQDNHNVPPHPSSEAEAPPDDFSPGKP